MKALTKLAVPQQDSATKLPNKSPKGLPMADSAFGACGGGPVPLPPPQAVFGQPAWFFTACPPSCLGAPRAPFARVPLLAYVHIVCFIVCLDAQPTPARKPLRARTASLCSATQPPCLIGSSGGSAPPVQERLWRCSSHALPPHPRISAHPSSLHASRGSSKWHGVPRFRGAHPYPRETATSQRLRDLTGWRAQVTNFLFSGIYCVNYVSETYTHELTTAQASVTNVCCAVFLLLLAKDLFIAPNRWQVPYCSRAAARPPPRGRISAAPRVPRAYPAPCPRTQRKSIVCGQWEGCGRHGVPTPRAGEGRHVVTKLCSSGPGAVVGHTPAASSPPPSCPPAWDRARVRCYLP
jgi:hypothetical protein